MPVSNISPDGSQRVDHFDLHGRAYDLPPWLTREEFAAGLAAADDENPLSSLIACELVDWVQNEDYAVDYPEDGPEWAAMFKVRWFLPYGSVCELVAGVFTPELPADPAAPMFAVNFTPTGAALEALVVEYRDITDVQAYLLPEPIADFTYTPRRGFGNGGYGYLEELFEELKANEVEVVERLAGPGIDGQVAHTTAPDGTPHLLVLMFHED